MRHQASGRRSRNRSGGGRNGNNNGNRNRNPNNRSQVFDSNGPDVRIRGTAHQIHEKYTALANDANSTGDFVMAESYMQHAEHYQRVINIWQEKENEKRAYQLKNSVRNEETKTETEIETKIETKTIKPKVDKEDLGLPPSILGETDQKKVETNTKVESKKVEDLEDA